MTKDLEAFKRIGIGGIVFYDQVHGDQLPGTELAMSKEWWDNVYYVARETERLGLDFEFHVSNGFVAGGPWIKPKDAMKRLESIETVVSGGKHYKIPRYLPVLRRSRTGYTKPLAFARATIFSIVFSMSVPNLSCSIFVLL